jgi:hypothetical protein
MVCGGGDDDDDGGGDDDYDDGDDDGDDDDDDDDDYDDDDDSQSIKLLFRVCLRYSFLPTWYESNSTNNDCKSILIMISLFLR